MHGCKEGQCASCKSFVLDGDDIELDRYSTFALPDFELEEGFTLLCRAHVFEDVTIELLNYDEEMLHSGHPIVEAVTEVVSKDLVTQDMRHLVLKLVEPTDIAYWPGQYVDIALPGTDETRSFSMANVSSKENGQLEFIIRCYPDGKFSHFLDTELAVGDRLDVSGPFGVFTLRDGRDSDMVFVGGGAGMAPILSVLRSLASKGSTRKVTYYYGARTQRDLCFEKELYALTETLPNFTLRPGALGSRRQPNPGRARSASITDVVKKYETDLSGADCYVCGPPPMVEAAMDVLERLGAPEKNIYYDKFTTTGSS